MAGLTAARVVADAGYSVVVLDKGRAVGGRMASRRIGSARYDHGAQHFSARSEPFRAAVRSWMSEGIAVEWFRSQSLTHPERGIEPRHAGADGMRGIPEHIAVDLDVRTDTRVLHVGVTPTGVEIHRSGPPMEARVAIVTAPLPQVVTMLDADPELQQLVGSIEYDPCLAVMAELEGPPGLPDGHVAPSHGPAAWIGDNAHKGVSQVPAVTIHSSPGFARAHLDADPDVWVPLLGESASALLEVPIRSAVGHRWRYSQPVDTLDTGVHLVRGAPIIVAGEVFGGARVEGAFLSGRAAGRRAVDLLRS
jgi:predicted NAD/FAD-dependent oxidoreductase